MASPLDIGESVVGAYLRYIAGCDFVVYGTQTEKQGEIDVIGFQQSPPRVWLCEVATHLDGLLYGSGNADTLRKVRQKVERAVAFADQMFPEHERRYEWWSPKAGPALVEEFQALAAEVGETGTELRFVINDEYGRRVRDLTARAGKDTRATGEPFYRALQILTHLPGGPLA